MNRVCSLGIGDGESHPGAEELMSVDQCETTRELDDSQFVGYPPGAVAAGADVAAKEDARALDLAVRCEPKVAETSLLKRKRGRPPRIMGKTDQQPPPQQRRKKDEEDVCFICFDGGSLVLCDRRGCPKAYHPSCIKRDEAFFRSKAKWNCGWHICSNCQKVSHYMCYTCTYSLCKECTKDADYVCVRGNKGLCGTCMKMIMLIENSLLGGTEEVQVDFDDKTNWEYLFKVYWVYLKAKLSLTLDELIRAKNPWKGEELPKAINSCKGAVALTSEVDSSGELSHVSDNCCSSLEANQSKRPKTENQPISLLENPLVREQSAVHRVASSAEGTMWATKELLQFVAHVKNGDISMLSQFDVQSLLLEYIKRNNLCDPHRESQIICDSWLIILFGKGSVSHFEMLKLLEYHFLVKDNTLDSNAVRAGVTAVDGSQLEAAANYDSQMTTSNDRRRKTRKKTDETGLQHNSNPNDYAAIDAYNINLLYLKRYLVENLMDDTENFHEKVVGSFVRIRIPGGDQKQDIYRLVQVVGTSKVAESYKVGTRTTDVMLEILNLNKEEVISIDEISNQDFSEDECNALRQSMKCGHIQLLTVGEIQTKAMALKAVKVSDRLEEEISRLNHLHDQSCQNGHRKKLRECVKKLQLLKSPSELHPRLREAVDVHTDPNMVPICESNKDAEKEKGDYLRCKSSGVGRTGAGIKSAVECGDISNDIGSFEQSSLGTTCERSQNLITTSYVDKDGTTLVHERNDIRSNAREQFELNDQHKEKTGGCHTQAEVKCESLTGVASPVLRASSAGRELSVIDFEADLWHYKDPSGKTQGPFSMMQLRKWYTSGLFPFTLRVWRINEKLDNSILLTDALVGRFHNDQTPADIDYLQLQEVTLASNDKDKRLEVSSVTADATWVGNRNTQYSLKSVKNDGRAQCDGSDELVKNGGWSSHSSSWTTLVDVAISNHGLIQSSSEGRKTSDISKSWCDQPQICRSILSPSVSVNLCETPPQVRDNLLDENLTSSPSDLNQHSLKTIKGQPEGDEKQAESDSFSSQSSGHYRSPLIVDSSSGSDSNSGFNSSAKSNKSYDLNQEINFFDLSIPAPKENHENLKVQASVIKQLVSSTVPILESGSSWSTSSSLVVSGGQIPELAGECGGVKTPSKPSAEEWESTFASASSWKPTEEASDLMATPTPTPESGQLTHSPPSHPVIDSSSWQQIEPNEFCSLADESVSDLLAEVEAMESLGGLPSPTSRMSCCEDMAQGSDNDCFSLIERICPTPEPGKCDTLSSSNDVPRSSQLTIAHDPLQLCRMPSQPIVNNGFCEMPSRLLETDQWLGLSYMPSQSTAAAELHGASKTFCLLTLTDEPLKVSHTDTCKPKTSFSVQSCSNADAERDRKLDEVSVNQWEGCSERQCHTASSAKRETDAKLHTIVSSVGQRVSCSDIQHPAPSTTEVSWGTVKGNAYMNQKGTAQGNTSWGTDHCTSQLDGRANSACSVGSPGSWENQPRDGDDRFSGPVEHRNYLQGRDSFFGIER